MADQRFVYLAAVLALLALPAAAQSTVERELALAPGGEVVLDADTGSVNVTGGSREGVHVIATSSKDDLEALFDFSFREEDGRVEITARLKDDEGAAPVDRAPQLRWILEVPSAASLDLATAGGSITVETTRGRAQLETSGGAITARRIEGDVRAETSGGSIRLERVTGDVIAETSGGGIHAQEIGGDVQADTSGGSIQVLRAAGSVTADTSGGSIRIEEAGGRVHADTSGGPVHVSFAPANAWGGSISAGAGTVRVLVDPEVSLDIDAVASGGPVTTELPVKVEEPSKNELHGTLGDGGQTLQIRAAGGSIRLDSL
jgi:hypothetical protein